MNTQSNAMPESSFQSQGIAPATVSQAQVLYWSIRRELWENRSIYIALAAVAVMFLFGFVVNMVTLRHRISRFPLDPALQHHVLATRYELAGALIMGTALIVGIFYCLDALYGERRDRSILFWKSLPVSDLTSVLSKASIPLVILPLVTFVIIIATQFVMLLWSSVVLLTSGLAGTTWTRFNLLEQSLILLYSLIALALWHAPIYGWLLLVSGWARRGDFFWAVKTVVGGPVFTTISF